METASVREASTRVIAALSAVLYWPPYRLTGLLARLAPPLEDVQSTYKLLIGMAVYPLWTVLVSALSWYSLGLWPGLLTLVCAPLIAVTGLWIRERWRGAWSDARRYFTLRSRSSLVETLRRRQQGLGRELQDLYQAWQDRYIPGAER